MKVAIDFLYEAKDSLDSIEVEYEGDPIMLSGAIEEAMEAINKAIRIIRGEE